MKEKNMNTNQHNDHPESHNKNNPGKGVNDHQMDHSQRVEHEDHSHHNLSQQPVHHETHSGNDDHQMQRDDAESHSEHEGHVDHTGHEDMFRKRFWVSSILSIPVLVFSSAV